MLRCSEVRRMVLHRTSKFLNPVPQTAPLPPLRLPRRSLRITFKFSDKAGKVAASSGMTGFLKSNSKVILPLQAVGICGSAWYLYQLKYNSVDMNQRLADTVFTEACLLLLNTPGMGGTIFHTHPDEIANDDNCFYHFSHNPTLGNIMRVVFFATMQSRRAVITGEYLVNDGVLTPRVILATIDVDSDHESFKVIHDNRSMTDGGRDFGLIAGEEAPSFVVNEAEDAIWDTVKAKSAEGNSGGERRSSRQ